MSKLIFTKVVSDIVNGGKDSSGNRIINVLAKQNELAIYEIDHPVINNKLRILIDGHTNELETLILNRFNKVKQKYIEEKWLGHSVWKPSAGCRLMVW